MPIVVVHRHNSSNATMGDPEVDSDQDEKMPSHTWHENQDYVFQNYNPQFEKAHKAAHEQNFDWKTHCATHYTDEVVAEASTWQKAASHMDSNRPSVAVDLSTLNADQAFIHSAVVGHDAAWQLRAPDCPVQPLAAMVNGTAGSGKTYLIHALLQHLGDRAITAAPTGVAADNIGGATYHSIFKIPCWGDLKRKDIINGGVQKQLNELLRERSPKLEYVIFDEMSMMGKRQLGQIDHMLRHGTGNVDQMFGGLNVIFFGDHGQLPPVKDERTFSWAHCKHERTSAHCRCRPGFRCGEPHAGDWKREGVQHWHEKGLMAHEHILDGGNIFYLRTIERCKGSSGRHEMFRQVQLAMRNGEATAEHHDWLWKNCSKAAVEERGELDDFTAATRLVCTKKMRDEVNAAEAERLIAAGAPSLVVHATDTDTRIKALADGKGSKQDLVRFVSTLTLVVGMEVLVNKNLCVKHGLVNGTRGVVHDVIINKTGLPVAVLMVVKARTSTSGGYSGPPWSHGSGGSSPVPPGHCLIAIPQDTERLNLDGEEHTRTQFPLMAASALTVHKAQGLTLDKVVFDPGNNEPTNSVGVFFVGLTRVKDPHDLMLVRGKGFPNVERLLQVNDMPSMIQRHNHEVRLWNAFVKLCSKLAHFKPGPASSEPPPKFRKHPSKKETQSRKRPTAPVSNDPSTGAKKPFSNAQPKEQPQPKQQHTPQQSTKEKQKAQREPQQQHVHQQYKYLEHHKKVVTDNGMRWPVGVTHGRYFSPSPSFAVNARQQGAQLRFRVIDLWSRPETSQSGQVVQYLGNMFSNSECVFDTPTQGVAKRQIGCSCGVVAAGAVALMIESGDQWLGVDVGSVVHEDIPRISNEILQYTGGMCSKGTWFLEGGHITELIQVISGVSHANLAQRFQYAAYDQCLAVLMESLRDLSFMPGHNMPPRFIVSNSCLVTQPGVHWFTVAYQLVWP